MNCLSSEILRAKIDGELSGAARLEADRHLAACEECRRRLEAMAVQSSEVSEALSTLAPGSPSPENTEQALARFQARREAEWKPSWRDGFLAGLFSRHPVPAWSSAALAAMIVALVTFAPARSVAQRVLAMLRVQKIAVVPVNLPSTPGPDTVATIRRLISDRIVVTLSPGKPQAAANASEASQMAGFPVRVLSGAPGAPKFAVAGEQAFVMTLDKDRLQEILNEMGHPDLQIPDSVNGKTIAVHIPKAVFARYGNCPDRGMGGRTSRSPGQAPDAQSASNCMVMVQAPSPIVSVPPDLNVSQLAEVGLEATGMNPEEADAFCQTVDWTSTLVIPIPSRASSYEKTEVDGAEGALITSHSRNGHPAHYSLIWVKKGMLYSLIGSGDPANAVAMAESLN